MEISLNRLVTLKDTCTRTSQPKTINTPIDFDLPCKCNPNTLPSLHTTTMSARLELECMDIQIKKPYLKPSSPILSHEVLIRRPAAGGMLIIKMRSGAQSVNAQT